MTLLALQAVPFLVAGPLPAVLLATGLMTLRLLLLAGAAWLVWRA